MRISIYNVKDEPIGYGGMGKVYVGTDPNGHVVAIKEMLAQYVADADLRNRFHQEIKILYQLEHPSIVKMYASFEERGNLFLVMEYVEGETIEQYVKRRGALPESEAVRLLIETLSALGFAHQNGFVHRDIKPGNIMIRSNGKICLLDFGIAKDMNRTGNGLTVGQMAIGTDGYMSPEQAEGMSVDHRSDIYSLGCVFYYMLVGSHAIQKQSNDYATRMNIIKNMIPRAKDYLPNLSEHIQHVLDKATHKNMLMRFQSCREFELELNSGATAVTGNSRSDDTISVGRESCDVIVLHTKVSRRHLDITKVNITGSGVLYKLFDRSANGTTLNGENFRNSEKTWQAFGDGRNKERPHILLAGEVELPWDDVENAFNGKRSEKYQAIQQAITTPPPQVFHPEDATVRLIVVYICSVLGGILGVILGAHLYRQTVSLPDGKNEYKFKQSHRTAALAGAVLSAISMIVWMIIMSI